MDVEGIYFDVEDDENTVLTEAETDVILSELKDELLLESILEQIKNPLNSSYGNSDYLEIFRMRYNYLKEAYGSNKNFIKKLKELKYKIYFEIFDEIVRKFNLEYSPSNLSIEDCVYDLYSFFVLNYKDNIVDYIINIIIKEKKNLVKDLKHAKYSKSIGCSSLKKIFKYKEDAIILSNITNIINNIVNLERDNLDVISDICENDFNEVSNYNIYQYFITGFAMAPNNDFNDIFFKPLKKKEEGYTHIINDVRNHLLNINKRKDV